MPNASTARLNAASKVASPTWRRQCAVACSQKGLRSCWRAHAEVGWRVTLRCRSRRRSWARTTNTNKTRQVSVGTAKKSIATVELTWFLRRFASSERVACAAAASTEKRSAQRPRTPASTTPHGSEARPRVGSRRPSPGLAVGSRRRPAGDRRAIATGESSTTRSRGDATPQRWPVGRRPRPTSNPAMRLAAQSRTADRANAWWASAGCADREPAAAAAPGSRESNCGVGTRGRSGAEQSG